MTVALPGAVVLTAHLDFSAADAVVGSCAELTPQRLGELVARRIGT